MVDPDNSREENAPLQESDDTKTRKTVRLRPSAMTPTGINVTPLPKPGLTDPLSGRDTDTGNLEVMEDTQTRRTVKLRPITTPAGSAAAVSKPLPVPGGAPAAPAADGSNTQTRKTIVLKPTSVAPAVKLDGPTGAAPSESDDTKTRKTVRLRPTAVAPPHLLGAEAPGAAPAAPAAAEDFESSDTIKIARPPRPGSMIPPPPTVPGAHAAAQRPVKALPAAKPLPSQTPLPKVGEDLSTSSTAVPRVPGIPAALTPPAAATPVAKPAKPADAADDIQLKSSGSSNTDAPAPETKSPLSAMQPLETPKPAASKLYLGIAVACILLVGCTMTLTLVQYLNLCQQQNIELPFLSK